MLYTGVEHADMLTTTSPSYAEEITGEGGNGFGLSEVLGERKVDLHGIVNGIDTRQWNPSTDKLIKKRYAPERMDGKAENKLALLGEVKLPSDTDRPVVGVIMNFDEFQGAGLIASSLKKLAAMDIQLVICGSGDQKYEKQFRVIC